MSVPSPAEYLKRMAVTAYIGTKPVRAQEGRAMQGWPLPYVTWAVVDMVPEIRLDGTPPIDACRIQIDVWASSASACHALALAIRDEIEPDHDMLSMEFPGPDPETNAWRGILQFSFWHHREADQTSSN